MEKHSNFTKAERIKSQAVISSLMSRGQRFYRDGLTCIFLQDNDLGQNRILISIPKRNFKRAVKRNLIRRRIREAYRLNKDILQVKNINIMLIFAHKFVPDYKRVEKSVRAVMGEINTLLSNSQ